MSDFLWHSVSESEKEKIKKEAKAVMDNFSKKLSKVKEKIPEPLIEREQFERVEGLGKEPDLDFKKRILDNAENKNDDFIIAEKKKW